MTYVIESGVLIAVAETPDETQSQGSVRRAIGTIEQMQESLSQAESQVSEWRSLIDHYEELV